MKKKVKNRIYEAGTGVNLRFCVDGWDCLRDGSVGSRFSKHIALPR